MDDCNDFVAVPVGTNQSEVSFSSSQSIFLIIETENYPSGRREYNCRASNINMDQAFNFLNVGVFICLCFQVSLNSFFI